MNGCYAAGGAFALDDAGKDAARTRTSFQESRILLFPRRMDHGSPRKKSYRGTASPTLMSSRHPRALRASASS